MAETGRWGSGILRFFGLDTGAAAVRTVLWTLPYVLALGAGLVGLSWLSTRVLQLPAWVYALAITLALLYVFFFLARLHRLDQQAHEPKEVPDEE